MKSTCYKLSLILSMISLLLNVFTFEKTGLDSPSSYDLSSLEIINDYDQGIRVANESQKPIFLLFTGKKCANNQSLAQEINENKELKDFLSEEFVNVWLYVDDANKLPKKEVVERDGQNITLRTFGNKWAHLEISTYGSNIQPLAVIIDQDESEISAPKSYEELTGSIEEYIRTGLKIFQNQK